VNALESATTHLLDLFVGQSRALALILLDGEGRIVRWLAGASGILGYEEAEVLGRQLDFLMPQHDRERGGSRRELQDAQTVGEHTDTRWLVRKDRTLVCVDSVLTPLRDEHGGIAGYSKMLRVAAAPRSDEAAVRRQNEQLLADDARKNEFIAMLAHELRNVIAPLSSAAQLLQATSGGKLDQPVEIIRRQAGFIAHLVEELVEETRIDRGDYQLGVAETDLAVPLAQALEACDDGLTARGQSVLVALERPVILEADAVRLRQVLTNLISNASKYSPEHASIRVKGEVEDGHAVLRVIDNGRGIAPEFLPYVFEKFRRAEQRAADDPATDGLGLGLAIVKSIVDMHGGSVEMKSDGAGKGCECVVRLPLSRKAVV
jgi:two-component system CheB/CheR fusion protein